MFVSVADRINEGGRATDLDIVSLATRLNGIRAPAFVGAPREIAVPGGSLDTSSVVPLFLRNGDIDGSPIFSLSLPINCGSRLS